MGGSLPAVVLGRPALSVTAGGFGSCALLDDASVRCWGAGASGALGQGDTTDRGDNPNEMGSALPPIALGTGTVVALAAGKAHACALFQGGAVKCWGSNRYGQLGQGDTEDRGDEPSELGDALSPIFLGTGSSAKLLDVGGDQTCVVLNDDRVKCWGANSVGQLGLGDTNHRGDQAGEMEQLATVDLGSGRTATSVAVGLTHACALLTGGDVKCWGFDSGGQLGQGKAGSIGTGTGQMGDNLAAVDLGTDSGTALHALAIDAGQYHSCARLSNGAIKCWGLNNVGQLGQGDVTGRGDGPNQMGDELLPIDFGAQ